MLRIDKVIVVEGRYDRIKLDSVVDAVIIETEGFGIFKDKEKQRLLRQLAEKKGLLILTDSDSAGFMIRSFLTGIVPPDYITNAYIPDIFGKEKRKDRPSREGKLGVEGVAPEVIKEALEKAGVLCSNVESSDRRRVTALDFYEDGLSGGSGSSARRKTFLRNAGLPERMSAKAMLEIINIFMTYDEYKAAAALITEEEK